ncbi:MAG: hypothetical protein ABI548_19565 [Polyangiaceae bacterium]
MMNPIKTRISILAAALLCGLATLGLARSAEASPTYPPFLQAALEKQLMVPLCIPQCTACHLTNLGGFGNLNSFGTNLHKTIAMGGGNLQALGSEADVGAAVTAYFTAAPMGDSDGDGTSDADEIKKGDSPSVAGVRGQAQFCPDIKYGCAGGRIASAPARDDKPALFAAGLVVVGLSAAMRRRRRRAQPRP